MATVFVLEELSYEYNDEVSHPTEDEAGTPIKVFRKRENAEAERVRLNAVADAEHQYRDYDEKPYDCGYYKVVEVELEDEDVAGYASIQEQMKKLRQEKQRQAQAVFKAEAAKLFDAHATLQSFGWRQYTPYFNDGDACTFSVHTDEPDINDKRGYDMDHGREYDRRTGKSTQVRDPDPDIELQPVVSKLLNGFDEDDMKHMFGDHVRVTVRRGGEIDVDDYSHD